MSEQSTQRPAVIAALDSLVDTLLANPLTAPLAQDGNWSVHSNHLGAFIRLIQHVHSEAPETVLDAVRTTFGGDFTAGGSLSGGLIWHELATEWAGTKLDFSLAAPGMSAEEALRARVAELEQQLAVQPTEPIAVRPLADAQGGAA
jgi:hypothetical protein